MKRKCPICSVNQVELIYTQRYRVPDVDRLVTHRIVSCITCGFMFVHDAPDQTLLDSFYKINRKYIRQKSLSIVPQIRLHHRQSFVRLHKYLQKQRRSKSIAILDIGCASGDFLALFAKAGYTNVTGIDPAPECKMAARRNYGISVNTSTLEEYSSQKKYDLITLYAVLEHISDLSTSMQKISSLLNPGGVLFICVPFAERFGEIIREPFMEFSLEHVNFFTKRSLSNLANRFGFKKQYEFVHKIDNFGSIALDSVFVKDCHDSTYIPDVNGKILMEQYTIQSEKALSSVEGLLSKLAEQQLRINVWGVGSLTSRLLATTSLAKIPIVYFVDSNSSLQGKKLMGREIVSPDMLHRDKHPVLITSYIYQKIIADLLQNQYGFPKLKVLKLP